MHQLFLGLRYLHKNYIIHRDIKVSNLLFNQKGVLKIADFGLARKCGALDELMSPCVVTLWYRAPEILLQSNKHTAAMDMWSAGCVFGELLLQKPLLTGKSEMQQIEMIIDLIGTPNSKIWPEFSCLPIPKKFILKHQPFNNISHVFSSQTAACIRLLNLLLVYDPTKRSTAEDSLQSSYFHEHPLRK